MSKSEQGVSNNRYQVVPRTLIFILNEDQVLLIKGSSRKRLWANQYNGIGGHVEKGEDIYTSARRELLEEAGFDCEGLSLCGSVMIDVSEQTGIHLFIFKGAYCGGNLQASDEGTLEWVNINQLLTYPLVEDLKTILPVILGLNKKEMIYGTYHYDDQEHLRISYIKR